MAGLLFTYSSVVVVHDIRSSPPRSSIILLVRTIEIQVNMKQTFF